MGLANKSVVGEREREVTRERETRDERNQKERGGEIESNAKNRLNSAAAIDLCVCVGWK